MFKMDKIGVENGKSGKIVSKGAKMDLKGQKALLISCRTKET